MIQGRVWEAPLLFYSLITFTGLHTLLETQVAQCNYSLTHLLLLKGTAAVLKPPLSKNAKTNKMTTHIKSCLCIIIYYVIVMWCQTVLGMKDNGHKEQPNIKTAAGYAVCSWATCSINHTAQISRANSHESAGLIKPETVQESQDLDEHICEWTLRCGTPKTFLVIFWQSYNHWTN